MALFSILLLFLWSVVGQRNPHGIRVYSNDKQVARLDSVTGTTDCITPVVFPNTSSSSCDWVLGDGTMGQTSAIFFLNMSYLFVAQEHCSDGGVGRTALLSNQWFPSCSGATQPVRAFPVAYLDLKSDINDLNMAWDHACNIVVISEDPSGDMFHVNQVSFYDGAQRYQPSYPATPGWRKVSGLGALDFGNSHTTWIDEWYCGDQCTFYTLEQQIVDGVAVQPSHIIGRSYRTAQVLVNITDDLQAQSLTWNIFAQYQGPGQFIGIGKCCSEAWCNPNCKGIEDGNLVLISFRVPESFTVLADIGKYDADTVRLGVQFSPAPYSKPPHQIYVFHANTVITYDAVEQGGLIVQAKKTHQSPPVDFKVHMWGNSGMV